MKRLVIDGFGKFLGIEDDQIVVREKGSVIHRVPPGEIRQVIISGKGSLSTHALEKLLENQVDVLFIDFRGKIRARIYGPILRTVKTRREQYKAFDDERSVILSKEFAKTKIKNQYAVLGTIAKARKDYDAKTAQAIMNLREKIRDQLKELDEAKEEKCNDIREKIMGIEGNSSSYYWLALSKIFPTEFNFAGRTGRYATDPINAMLNYGYGVLLGDVLRAIHLAGLDPYAGFLHVDRPGRESMALDLIEEFRQQVVDKPVIKLVTKKQVSIDDFEIFGNSCRIKDDARLLLLREVLGKLESKVEYRGKKYTFTQVIQKQAIQIAKFLRGEISSYRGFYLRW
ncbi:MAG: CRISPR-associated endonuclease Cas1 [Actinomycetota bacterium]